MAAITSDMKVGEIVRNWPETMKVFLSHNLNLQCGGIHTVAFAAGKHEFDLETFLAELNAAVADTAEADRQRTGGSPERHRAENRNTTTGKDPIRLK